MSNAAHILVSTPRARNLDDADITCVIGRDLKIDPQALQDYCAELLSDAEHDLVVLCGVVTFADRVVRRRRASGWAREMEITLPVCAPEIWRQDHVYAALVDALEFVTGDSWRFNFVPGGAKTAVDQPSFKLSDGPYIVLPSSDGMDSYLQWQLLIAEEIGCSTLRVQTSNRATNETRNKAIDALGAPQHQRLRLPISTTVGNHPEPTYRTRTFLYFCMAALAAVKSKSRRVVIGENGVGALGPSMIRYGNECPHRTSHPGFTRRLETFLNALLASDLKFEHPQIFRTKGEVLIHATRLGVNGWEKTNSCVRGPRDKLENMGCGTCSGCLLRRTAILAAGFDPSGYFWEALNAATLDEARSLADGRDATTNDLDILHHGAHAMSELAGLAQLRADADVFQRAAWDMLGPVRAGVTETAQEIHRLIGANAEEWRQLQSYFGTRTILQLKEAG